MAKSDDIYDHPRSKPKGVQEAKKGDVKKGIDPLNPDQEYESVGHDASDDFRRDEENRATEGSDKRPEYWRPKKREIPTS